MNPNMIWIGWQQARKHVIRIHLLIKAKAKVGTWNQLLDDYSKQKQIYRKTSTKTFPNKI